MITYTHLPTPTPLQWCFNVSGIGGSLATGPVRAPNATAAKNSDPAFAVGDGLVLYGEEGGVLILTHRKNLG